MIQVEDISFTYQSSGPSTPASLEHVSVDIHPGESIAIMGHNGSGKTTFARCLNGLLVPTSGNVLVDGLNVADEASIPQIRRRVGMVFQNPDNQIVSTTVEREIAFGLENLGVAYEDMHRLVDEVLRTFDMTHYRLHSPHLLSGGEKQRLALAAVIAMRPKYLVLDEPTSLLDPRSRRDILAQVKTLHGESGNSIATILITQFPEEAMQADRLIVFSRGCIVFDDAPEKVFALEKELQEIGLEPPLAFKVDKLLHSLSVGRK